MSVLTEGGWQEIIILMRGERVNARILGMQLEKNSGWDTHLMCTKCMGGVNQSRLY